jgi:hypothetical protein
MKIIHNYILEIETYIFNLEIAIQNYSTNVKREITFDEYMLLIKIKYISTITYKAIRDVELKLKSKDINNEFFKRMIKNKCIELEVKINIILSNKNFIDCISKQKEIICMIKFINKFAHLIK